MTTNSDKFMQHQVALLNAVFSAVGSNKEGKMTSFDSIEQAALEPPEPKSCHRTDHILDTNNVSSWEDGMITVECQNCDAVARLQAMDVDWEL